MPKLGQKGIAHLLLIILLVAGIGLIVYLIGQKTNLFPQAASNPISGPITPSPAETDSDGDKFSDSQEAFMGTNPSKACGVDAWPVDTNNDTGINGTDISRLVPYISGELAYNKRYDLNQDGVITQQGDVPVIQRHMFETCVPSTEAGYSFDYNPVSDRSIGNEFVVNLIVKTNNQAANTFYANLRFDPSKLEVTNIAMDDWGESFITQVDDSYFNNDTGEISLLGGLPTPGFTSSAGGNMAQLTFRVKQLGQTVISIEPDSQIISESTSNNIISESENLVLSLGPIATPTVSPSISPNPTTEPSASVEPVESPSPSPSAVFQASSSPSPAPTVACTFSSAKWVTFQNPMTAGNTSVARVEGTDGCVGKKVSFTVKEDDGLLGTEDVAVNPEVATFNLDNFATSAWIAEFQQDGFNGINNPPEYFFTATLVDDPQITITSSTSEELVVNNLRIGEFINGDGNKDGKVDILDLSILRKWWGRPGFPQEIDIDDNGVLNTFDLGGLRKILQAAGIIKTRTSP